MKKKHGEIRKLLSPAIQRALSRRDFINNMVAAGMTVSAASLLWAPSTSSAQSEAKPGGTYRLAKGHGATTDTLDPATYLSGFILCMAYGVYNYLTEVNPADELVGEVAESWESDESAIVWRFKIRDGITFHDGMLLTAKDVVASINHHRGENSTSAAKPIVEPIVDIQAESDNMVMITLDGGNADFPYILANYQFPIMPSNEDGTLDWKSGIGSGGYVLKNFDAGVRVDLEKYPNYWKTGRAHFDKVEILAIIDPTSRTNALVSGEVDAIDKVDLKTVALLGRSPNINIHSINGTQHFTFAMHTDVAPFDNKDVRMALKYAINREEMVEKILQGYGVVGNDHPIGAGQRFFASDLPQHSYDPEKAKEHLKAANLDSLSVDLHVSDAAFAGAIDTAQLYAESAKAANININIVREPNDGYWSNVWLKKPFCAVYWGGRPTEDWMFSLAYQSGADWNDTHFDNARFNELLVQARSELDEDKRRQMYYEMQDIVSNEGGSIIPMFASYVFATSKNINTGENMSTLWDMDGERSVERWWFDS